MIAAAARRTGLTGVRGQALQFDVYLLGVIAALLGLGIVMVYSATVATAEAGGGLHLLTRHGSHVVAGLVAMMLTALTPLAVWQSCGRVLLVLGLLLLALVLVPGLGVEVNGSRRWLDLGPLRAQPAEAAKLFAIVYAAGYLTRKQDDLRHFTEGVLALGVVLALLATMLLLEPDFGSAVVIILTVAAMMFLAGVRYWHFLVFGVAGGVSMALVALMSPYRVKRVTSFLDPWADPYASGFQLVQALIAFGRGEWLGVGLGASVQKLFYLPHASTDFLLAVIGEELGLVGVATVTFLFILLLWRSFAIARAAERAGELFAARLAQGAGLLIALQAMINMGVNMGVLPTKGLTLPFMSYGGSSMLASCATAGLILAVDRQVRHRERQ